MTDDQKSIYDYLKGWPKTFISAREIARKAGGRRRFDQDRGWATPILMEMEAAGMIESDPIGGYRIKPHKDKWKKKKFVSPMYLKVLKTSGQSFESFVIDEESEESAIFIKQVESPIPPPEIPTKGE